MKARRHISSLAIAALGLTTLGLVQTPAQADRSAFSSEASARLRAGSLSTSPAEYTAGQALTFTGNLGKPGVRPIALQLHMGRPGDTWFAVRGFSGKTTSDGSFTFVFPAPSMKNIRYRVVSVNKKGKKGTKGKVLVTQSVLFYASEQDIYLDLADSAALTSEYEDPYASAGQPFTLGVSTTPTLPVFSGRPVTLQMRTAPGAWQTVSSTTLAPDGTASFAGLVSPTAGTVVYRAVQADVTSGGNKIGWTQSYPYYVTVYAPGTEPAERQAPRAGSVSRLAPASARGGEAASAIAASKFNWWPSLYDYTWESGQSLTSPPELGKLNKGRWEDWVDGTGRVSRWNGGLNLASGPGHQDIGTTRATLRGAGQKYGRWEARLRFIRTGDFPVRVELVPENPADYACGRRNILLAEVSGASTQMTFGANGDTKQWRGSRAYGSLTSAPSLAVEVNKDHITWFLNSKPIGTVKDSAAVSDVPMTLRFSVIGDQVPGRETTNVNSDWQRAFSIKPGKQAKGGKKLAASALTTCE